MIYTTDPNYDPYPPYSLIDRLNSMSEIYDIFDDIPREDRLIQISDRREFIRDNVSIFKFEYPDLYYKITTEMEFAALRIALRDMHHGIKTCGDVKLLLNTIKKRYGIISNNEIPTIITIALLRNSRIPKIISFGHLEYIETYNLMDITKYSNLMKEIDAEYRQYKISKIIS